MSAHLQLAKNKHHTSKLNWRCLSLKFPLQGLKVVKGETTTTRQRELFPAVLKKWPEMGLRTAKPPGAGTQRRFFFPRLTCQPQFGVACSKTSWEKPTWKTQGGWMWELSSMKMMSGFQCCTSCPGLLPSGNESVSYSELTKIHLKTRDILQLDFASFISVFNFWSNDLNVQFCFSVLK